MYECVIDFEEITESAKVFAFMTYTFNESDLFSKCNGSVYVGLSSVGSEPSVVYLILTLEFFMSF
jgi:hypothetical protein